MRFGWSHHWQFGWRSRHGFVRATKTSGRVRRREHAAQHSRISGDIDLQGMEVMEMDVSMKIPIGDFCYQI